ncbi:glycosyltransferase family 31 protein [Xylaria scruposa]|nr:glycosyltransferase family 31 protein [Xylaria scruposa]
MFSHIYRNIPAIRLRKSRAVILVPSVIAVLIFTHLLSTHHANPTKWLPFHVATSRCPDTSLSKDVLLVVRTGATEVLEKLPVHFSTVLTCVPDYVIYSDLDENLEGHQIFDVLNQTTPNMKMHAPEFWLYNRLQTSGRDGMDYETTFGSGPAGALDNPGWKLDKWKFLPMVSRALEHRPKAKWFVFIEPDTYLFWQNMLKYLNRFDASKPHYIGRHMYIGPVLFGHGGSGFVISNPAMRMVSKHWIDNLDWFDEYTLKEWAGDMILGKAMENIGIPLVSASPHLQGDSLYSMDWTASRRNNPPWCYASLTLHHMTDTQIRPLWSFERGWEHDDTKTLRFRDIFRRLVHPQMQSEVNDWDNQSREFEYSNEAFAKLTETDRTALTAAESSAPESFHLCRAACEIKASCIQYFYNTDRCFLSTELRLGQRIQAGCVEYSHKENKCLRVQDTQTSSGISKDSNAARSGWIMDRVQKVTEEMDGACQSPEGNDWI